MKYEVLKRTRRCVSVRVNGADYRINPYGVFYYGADGNGGLVLGDDLSMSEQQEIADDLAVGVEIERHQGEPCLCYPDGRYIERRRAYA